MHPLRLSCALAALSALAALAAPGVAQDLLPKAAPQTAPVVLRNAALHTVTGGVLLGGTLWFQDGVIRGVHPAGEEPKLPDGAQPVVVDLQGKHVFPGMVAVGSQLGLGDGLHGGIRSRPAGGRQESDEEEGEERGRDDPGRGRMPARHG
jgi:hypothetical protein